MIHTHINTGSTLDLRLREALLVYTSEGHGPAKTYLEVRPIVEGPAGPQYGAGFPADAAYLARMLQRDAPPRLGFLSPRLLAVGESEAAWWSPAGRHTPFFTGGRKMDRYSGVEVAMPALLYHVRGRQLRIRALACRGRPGPRTPLYIAPLWNIYRNGSLCMGSMPVPDGTPAECTDAWERAFWDSAFTTPHDPRLCGHPKGYSAMLAALRRLPRFPTEWLVPSKERLEEWLNSR